MTLTIEEINDLLERKDKQAEIEEIMKTAK